MYHVRTGVDARLSMMWEETGVLREKPPVEASDHHTLPCDILNQKVPFLIDLVCTVNFKFLGYSRMLKPYF